MGCANNSPCFSGCVETVSDKCVKYTGPAVSFLGIETGDTLEAVEEKITDYLATVYSGKGIFPEPTDICAIVQAYLGSSPTLVDILTAVIKTICDIDERLSAVESDIATIETDYTVDCLSGVSASSGTHAVLQATITALCDAIDDIGDLYVQLGNYISIANIDSYIQNYLDNQPTLNKMYTKMVPYAIYPFWPTTEVLANFDSTGKGSGDWEKIYVCNGENNTPDLRGRSLTGVIKSNVKGTKCLDTEVDYANGHPDYTLGMKEGYNRITLRLPEMPAHIHTGIVSINDDGHKHIFGGHSALATLDFLALNYFGGEGYSKSLDSASNFYTKNSDLTNADQKTGITATVKLAASGQNQPHQNIHPVYAVHYIIYLP